MFTVAYRTAPYSFCLVCKPESISMWCLLPASALMLSAAFGIRSCAAKATEAASLCSRFLSRDIDILDAVLSAAESTEVVLHLRHDIARGTEKQ